MIAYFPEIYPDELVYSWFCRYYIHSGSISHRTAMKDLMYSKNDAPSKEFIGHLNENAVNFIRHNMSVRDLILNHTMYPQYARFIPCKKRQYALVQMSNNTSYDLHKLMPISPRNKSDAYLKYCPKCVSEDRRVYGETYWHRVHQIRGINMCIKHNCLLQQSSVISKNNQTFVFYPAEYYTTDIINEHENPINANIEYCEYLINIFQEPMSILNLEVDYKDVLNYLFFFRGYTKGSVKCIQKMYDDMKTKYSSMGISNICSFDQVQRALSGKQYDFNVICQIAFFLDLRYLDLLSPTKEILKWINVHHPHTIKSDKREEVNWERYDKESFWWFEQFVMDIYYGKSNQNGRPEYVSEKMICKQLDVSPDGLKNMPLCYGIYNKYKESYPENWARRIVWAYDKLIQTKSINNIYSSDIRKLSGVKEKNFIEANEHLLKYADNDKAKNIRNIISKHLTSTKNNC